jgi:lipopolysaccharide export system permease protein
MATTLRFPKLLYSYLATEILAPFFASFVVMNSVFFLITLIPFLNTVLELEINFVDFTRLFIYLFPDMFLYSIPMAAMIGVTVAFTRLSNDSEILAFKASGISLYQFIPPVLFISLLIALLTSYFSINLISESKIALKQLMFQVAKEKIDKGIKEDQFTEALGDLVVYVESIDPDTGMWKDVWVSDMRGQVNPIITMAQAGIMTAKIDKMLVTITLLRGSLHRPDGMDSQIIGFDKYIIDIPLQTPTTLDGKDVTRLSTASMTMSQLQEYATTLGRDTPEGREKLVHYHTRIALPFGCLLLSLLGMPLGLQAGPGRKSSGIPLALFFFILYYIVFTVGKVIAQETVVPVFVAMWLPNVIFLLITVYYLKQTANERPVIPPLLKKAFKKLMALTLSPLLAKLRGAVAIFKKPKKEQETVSRASIIAPEEIPSIQMERSHLGPDYLTEGTVHGNIKSHIFHLPECEFYYCKNCTIEFKDIQVARESGFEPCRFCKTLLHPTSD